MSATLQAFRYRHGCLIVLCCFPDRNGCLGAAVTSEAIIAAAEKYKIEPTPAHLTSLAKAVEAPRVKLFRRMNMAPDATAVLVKMRGAPRNS